MDDTVGQENQIPVIQYLLFAETMKPFFNFQYTGFQSRKTHAQLNTYYKRIVGEHNFQKKDLTIHCFKVRYYLQKILLYFEYKVLLLDSLKH